MQLVVVFVFFVVEYWQTLRAAFFRISSPDRVCLRTAFILISFYDAKLVNIFHITKYFYKFLL